MTHQREPVRVGIVGAGEMAREHIAAWRRIGVEPVAVLARTPRAPLDAAATIPVVVDLDAFLADVDVVDICTPTDTHAGYATAAAAAGRDVLCEKPLALEPAEAQEIVDLFAARGLVLQVGHLLRFHPHVRRLVGLVREGILGELVALRLSRVGSSPAGERPWFADPARVGGVLMDLMIHDLDLAAWIAGPVTGVRAVRTPDPDPTAFALLEHEGGALSRLDASWSYPPGVFRAELEVVGRSGVASYRFDTGRGELQRGAHAPEVWADEPVPSTEVFARVAANFLALRAGEGEHVVPGAAAVEAVRLAREAQNLADRSASDATDPGAGHTGPMASNASGNQSESAQTWDEVDSGQSDDIENSLTGQGTSDREMTKDVARDEAVEEHHRAEQ